MILNYTERVWTTFPGQGVFNILNLFSIPFRRHLGLQRNFKHIVTMQPDVAQRFCHKIHFLSDQQKELCSSNEQFLSAISRGVKLGLDECKAQFRMSHWNCTPDANTQLLYGEVMERGEHFFFLSVQLLWERKRPNKMICKHWPVFTLHPRQGRILQKALGTWVSSVPSTIIVYFCFNLFQALENAHFCTQSVRLVSAMQ